MRKVARLNSSTSWVLTVGWAEGSRRHLDRGSEYGHRNMGSHGSIKFLRFGKHITWKDGRDEASLNTPLPGETSKGSL